jgi:AcrR family transcriptional regulator
MTNQMDSVPRLVTDLIVPEREGGYLKGRETRELILRTALTILIEHGYPAMSMRRVAAECGMKFGNLTYHYRSREDLVRELLEAVIRSYEVEFAAIAHMPGASPRTACAACACSSWKTSAPRRPRISFPRSGPCRTTNPSCST